MTSIEELKDVTPEEQRQLDALRALLYGEMVREGSVPRPEEITVSIYCFRDTWGGVRISEISYSRPGGGSSYMASDLDSFPVIFAAERYLMYALHGVEDHGGGAVLDLEQEARRGLLYWLRGATVTVYNAMEPWEERTENPLYVKARLEHLRQELRAERISYGELAELQSLADHIDPGDVELLEAAGVPEHPDDA
jgi:hypothetical protein